MDKLKEVHNTHLSDYYRRLYDERRTELPPLPAELASERLALQEAIRRRLGEPKFVIEETPPRELNPSRAKLGPAPFQWDGD